MINHWATYWNRYFFMKDQDCIYVDIVFQIKYGFHEKLKEKCQPASRKFGTMFL